MTKAQIINCDVFSDEEINQSKGAAIDRTGELVAELVLLMNQPVSNSIRIIYC